MLVGYWPLNQDDEDTAYDYSGNENHGAVDTGVLQGDKGILGGTSYRFEGSEEVQVPDSQKIQIGGSHGWSYTAWVKTTDTEDTDKYVLIKWDGAEGSYYLQTRNGQPGARINQLGSLGSQAGKDVINWADGEWHHAVCVYDEEASNEFKMYIDGRLEDETSGNIDGSESSPLDIGHYGGGNHFNGNISEIRIYSRALTLTEIQYIYNVSRRGIHISSKKST